MNRFLLAAHAQERAPFGLRPAGPLALLLDPHVPPRVRIVARASPAGPGGPQQNANLFLREP
jgi:hypothetical protein